MQLVTNKGNGDTVNYYRRFPGDYLRDTMGLNLLQHGAYTLLLDCLYATEEPIPSEEEAFRICRAVTEEERWAVTEILQKFFKKTASGFTNKRFGELLKERKEWRKRQRNKRDRERDIPVTVTPVSTRNPLSTLHSPLTTNKTLKAFPHEFELFWNSYPRKVAKPDAIKAFLRKDCAPVVGEVLAGLTAWKESEQWQDLEYVPYPATWINREGWKELPPKPVVVKKPDLEEQRLELERKLGIGN